MSEAGGPASSAAEDEKVAQLVALGFPESVARSALLQARGNVDLLDSILTPCFI